MDGGGVRINVVWCKSDRVADGMDVGCVVLAFVQHVLRGIRSKGS